MYHPFLFVTAFAETVEHDVAATAKKRRRYFHNCCIILAVDQKGSGQFVLMCFFSTLSVLPSAKRYTEYSECPCCFPNGRQDHCDLLMAGAANCSLLRGTRRGRESERGIIYSLPL